MGAGTAMEHFSNLEDPGRHPLKNRHKPADMIAVSIITVHAPTPIE
jgi:hypothetical protein